MPDEEGKPTEVYIFQGDKYIDHVEKVQTYNRVMAEQTEEDTVNYIEQRKKIAKFGKYVREHAIEQVGVMRRAGALPDGGTVGNSGRFCLPEVVSSRADARDTGAEALVLDALPEAVEVEALRPGRRVPDWVRGRDACLVRADAIDDM